MQACCCSWLQDLTEYLEGKSDHSQFIQLAVPDFEVRGGLALCSRWLVPSNTRVRGLCPAPH